VKLRWEYDEHNRPNPQPQENVFVTINQDRKEFLHHYITAGQRALLNPGRPHNIFLAHANNAVAMEVQGHNLPAIGQPDNNDQLAFTRNVVVLEITGKVQHRCRHCDGFYPLQTCREAPPVPLGQADDCFRHFCSESPASACQMRPRCATCATNSAYSH
jgi:hypothetical protein